MNSKSPKNLVIVAAKDAGGCNSLIPVINRLKKTYKLITVADYPASLIFNKNNIKVDIFKRYLSKRECDRLFLKESPVSVLLGTSWRKSIEDSIVEGASRYNIPSIGILDSWLRYDERFSANKNRWFYLPDYLVVMDRNVKRDMIKLGAPKHRIFPIGNPFFDNIRKKGAKIKKKLKGQVIRREKKRILFLSEPNSLFNGNPQFMHRDKLGYDEFVVLKDLVEIVRKIETRRKAKIELLLKLHPAERNPRKYRNFIDKRKVKVVNGELYKLMYSVDLVVGMQSMGLVEACILNIVNLSYQPGLKTKEMLVTNRLRVGQFCYSKKGCEQKIEKLLFDRASRKRSIDKMKSFLPVAGITGRAVAFIYTVIDSK